MKTKTHQKVLLAVFAHPDDETFGTGGSLAHYASQGVDVHLVCATRGEVGEVEPELMKGYQSIGELREHELRCAAQHLALAGVHFLDYRDSGMEGSPEFESLDFVQALPAKAVVYDLVYHPTDTALLRAAEHRGLTAVGGLALLVQQAALAFARFSGTMPDADLCRSILRELEEAQ